MKRTPRRHFFVTKNGPAGIHRPAAAGNGRKNGFRPHPTLTFLTFLHFWRSVHGL